jgi:hypothetical protein
MCTALAAQTMAAVTALTHTHARAQTLSDPLPSASITGTTTPAPAPAFLTDLDADALMETYPWLRQEQRDYEQHQHQQQQHSWATPTNTNTLSSSASSASLPALPVLRLRRRLHLRAQAVLGLYGCLARELLSQHARHLALDAEVLGRLVARGGQVEDGDGVGLLLCGLVSVQLSRMGLVWEEIRACEEGMRPEGEQPLLGHAPLGSGHAPDDWGHVAQLGEATLEGVLSRSRYGTFVHICALISYLISSYISTFSYNHTEVLKTMTCRCL